jgi:cell wall-associated NlpC family hydrolase
VVAAVLVVLTFPGTSGAAPGSTPTPKTSTQARAQILALGRKLDATSEKYNTAKITLARRQREAAAARAEVARVNARLRTLEGEVKTIAVSSYQSGQLGAFSSFVGSKSPQAFLDKLSALDMISHKQASVLRSLSAAKVQAQKAQQAAARAVTAARKTTAELKSTKAWMATKMASLHSLLARLTAKERAAMFAAQQRAAAAKARAAAAARQAAADRASRAMARQAPAADPAPVAQPKPQPAPQPAPVGSSSKAATAVQTAMAQLGKPYVWGAAGPDSFDCSGLMEYAWQAAGVSLPHSSSAQYDVGTHVSESELQPGDLVFYYSPISHVGMYIGNGKIINAPEPGDVIKIVGVNDAPYAGATRVG